MQEFMSWFRFALEFLTNNLDLFERLLYAVAPGLKGDAEVEDSLAAFKEEQSPERYAALKTAVEAKGGDMERVEREVFNKATVQV